MTAAGRKRKRSRVLDFSRPGCAPSFKARYVPELPAQRGRTGAGAAVHALELIDAIRNGRMREHQPLPESLQLLPERHRLGIGSNGVVERVDRHDRPQRTQQFLLLTLRPVLLDVGDELLQSRSQGTRVLRHPGAGGISTGLTGTNDEHLDHLRHLAGEPEDNVHDQVHQDARERDEEALRLTLGTRLDAEHLAEQSDRTEHKTQPGIDDEEEERRHHGQHRVDADVVVANVPEFVSENRFDLVIGQTDEEKPLGCCHHGLAVDRTSGEGVGQRIVRDVDGRLVLEAALQPGAVNDVDQPLVLGVGGVGRHRLGHHQRHLGAEPPHDRRQEDPQQAEAQLKVIRGAEELESTEDERAHAKVTNERLQPSFDQTPANGTGLLIIETERCVSHKSCS